MNLHRQRRHGSEAIGFTLIEVMMVVAIIGLTLTIGLPSFLHTIRREGMGKVEYELVEACKAARSAAIMNNKPAHLTLHPLDGTFEVEGAYPQTRIPSDIVIDILGVNFIQLEKADVAQVTFFPNGISDEFTIVLHQSGGVYRKIYLDTTVALPVIEDIR